MSKFGFHVLMAIISDLSTIYTCNYNNSEQAIDRVDTETVVHYESQHQSHQYSLIIKSEVGALGVINISRGCFERCCSNKKTPT